MARAKTSVEYSDFTRGIITEASPLTFPDNASLDEQNININRDGSRQRRFGMDWDQNATAVSVTPLSTSGEAVSSYTWKSAGNDGEANVGVVQIGRLLKFYDLEAANPAVVVDTHTFSSGDVPSPYHQRQFSMTSAYGKLIVAVGTKTVYVFTWSGSGVGAPQSYSLNIRDRFGVDDGYAIDEQKTTGTISEAHWYNLRNQGWPVSTRLANLQWVPANIGSVIGDPTNGDPIQYTYNSLGFWPSNVDLFWAAKCEQLGGSPRVDNFGAYNPLELQKIKFGTTPAPKGKYIIDLFARGTSRQTVSGRTGLPADTTSGGIIAVGTFAGRIWYIVEETGLTGGDDNSPALGNMVFYSELSEDVDRWKNCHSRNDPTTEDWSDPLATDGGFITIPDMGQGYGLHDLGESMFILASNGVWEVFGGDAGFNAQDQTVVRVTDVGPLSRTSIIDGENVIAYFAESGIYAVSLDSSSLRGVAVSLTEETIQTLYDAIPISYREKAVGGYDYLNKQVMWLYADEDLGSDFYFNKELVLHTLKGGFTRRTYNPVESSTNSGPYPCGYLGLRSSIPAVEAIPVTAGGAGVTAGGLIVTVGSSSAQQRTKSSTMYTVAYNEAGTDKIRVAGQTNFQFTDWPQVPNDSSIYGVDAEAYLITGAITGGDTLVNKVLPYVHVRAKRTETDWTEAASDNIELIGESSILMSAQWDWTNDPSSGRWSRASQVYRLPRLVVFDPSHIFAFDVVHTRNKLRGKGKAVSLKFASEPGKDLFLYGWGLEVLVDK